MRRCPLIALLCLCLMSYAWADGVTVLVVERSPAYIEAAEAVAAGLGDHAVTVLSLAELGQQKAFQDELDLTVKAVPRPTPPRLVVAIGLRALQTALEGDARIPVVATLLPQAAYETTLRGAARRNVTAVYMDQPLARQLDLLRAALPGRNRVGVLLGPESMRQERGVLAALAERGFKSVPARLAGPQDLSAALKDILGQDADVLLALPDPAVWGTGTLQNILRSSIAARVPLVAFSPAYVKAGALLALYSTPAQIGAQAAQAARATLAGRMPAPQYPREFGVASNRTVMRALGLNIPEDAVLSEHLARPEDKR